VLASLVLGLLTTIWRNGSSRCKHIGAYLEENEMANLISSSQVSEDITEQLILCIKLYKESQITRQQLSYIGLVVATKVQYSSKLYARVRL
jgi:hypothetical protein